MRQFKKVQTVTDDYAEHFKKHENISEITREILVDLVDKIFIDKIESPDGNRKKQRKHVKVVFKFADEHKALLSFLNENAPPHQEHKLIAV
jgi:hypothetical protein